MSVVDEFYVLFRAQVAPFIEGMDAMNIAADKAAVAAQAAATEIVASTERMGLGAGNAARMMDEMALQGQIAYERLAVASQAAAMKMSVAANEAAIAQERLDAAFVASEAAAGKQAAAMSKRFALGALGAAIVAGATVKMAADFETATTRLVTSAGETHDNLGKVRDGILQMAGQVGNTSGELAKAMYIVESGGQHGAEGLKVLRAAAEGAAAEGANLYTVADALTSVLQDYHLKADQSALVTSKMVAAVGAGKTTFEEFSASLSAVLPKASAAHISFDDISASIAAMTVHGMSAQQASQNLADVITHLEAPTGVMTKELGQLGISSSDLADKLGNKGLTGTLQEISQLILSKMGPSGRVMLDALNQSKDAARDAKIMIDAMPASLQNLARGYMNGSISLKEWRTDLKALPPEQANLLAQWASLENRAKGFNDVLKSGSPAAQTYMDAMRRATGDATGLNVALMLTGENTQYVNDTLKKISGTTTEAGNHVKGWADIQETFNNKLHRAKAALGALGIEIGEKLLPAASKMMDWLAKGADWLSKHQAVATALAITIGVLAVALTATAVALGVVAAVGAVIGSAVGAVVFAVVGFIAIWILAYEKISWFHTAVNAYVHFWIALFTGWWHIFSSGWMGVWHILQGIGHWFATDFAGFFIEAWNKIKSAASAVGHFFTDTVPHFFSSMWDKITSAGSAALHWFQELPGRIVSFLSSLPGRLAAAAQTAMSALGFAIGYGIGKVYVFFTQMVPRAVAYLIDLRNRAVAAVVEWWNHTTTAISNGITKALTWLHDLPGRAVAYFLDLQNRAVLAVAAWWRDTSAHIRNGAAQAIVYVSALPGKIVAYVEDMRNRAVAAAQHMVNSFVSFMSSLPSRAANAISGLAGWIWSVVSGAGSWLWNAGQNIVQGCIDGIRSMVGYAINAARSFASSIVSGFKSAIGIASPSTVFAEAGGHIVAGLVAGIQGNAHKAVGAVADLANAMTLAPAISVGVGVRGGAGLAGPTIAAPMWRPPAQSTPAGVDQPIKVHAHLYLDGKEIFDSVVENAQRHKARNLTSALI